MTSHAETCPSDGLFYVAAQAGGGVPVFPEVCDFTRKTPIFLSIFGAFG
jgi:hypothetical protein